MSLFKGTKIHAFGLDISNTSIKIAELTLQKNQLRSGYFADVKLTDKIISNNAIISEQRLAESMAQAISQARHIDTKYVICSVPEAKSFVRLIQIPKMDESAIDDAVPFELEQDIPIPIDQVYMDWQILRELPDKLELLVTASSKDYIDGLVRSLHLAKLKPVAIEIASQATARALVGPANWKKSVMIVDIGAKQSSFVIVDENVPMYTSSIPVAGEMFTESISRNLRISEGEAEKLKLATGVLMQVEPGVKIRQAVLPILDSIIDEMKNVIRFFEEHSQTHRLIDTLIVTGGSAQVPGVLEYISARINLGSGKLPLVVSKGDPWVNVVTKTAKLSITPEQSLAYSTAIGLALRGVNFRS
jgi:type IV pilus assembly protein PilM